MIVTIQNECLTVDIEDLGAQLASVRNHHGTEYLWQGDADIWARRAPILFPVLCGLKDNTYLLDGVPYHMNKHGFARDCVFEVVEHTDTKASFRLTDNEETRRMYPFSFTLTVTYTLEENRLIKCHRVENRSEQVMYYELGVHDGFRAPLEEGETMGQYAIRLPGLEDAIEPYGLNEQSLVTPKNGASSLEHGRIALDPTTYHLDTVILDQPPQARAVLVDGQDITRMKEEELTVFRRRNIGFVFQSYNLVTVLNVEKNITLPIRLDGNRVDEEYIGGITSALGISDKRKAFPNQLSGGQQQRVAIARAIAGKPSVILADEPTGNLDSRTSAEVMGLLKMTSTRFHQTVIMITHNESIAQLADRTIHMEDGRIVGGTADV